MENNKELSGYITEKIFNDFLAGCVPCYQGDPEVTRWIPADTLSPWKESRPGRNWSGVFKASPRRRFVATGSEAGVSWEAPKAEFSIQLLGWPRFRMQWKACWKSVLGTPREAKNWA
jgi:hypothetical protein